MELFKIKKKQPHKQLNPKEGRKVKIGTKNRWDR